MRMPEPAREPTEHDPLLAYIDAELARPLAPEAMPEERDRHYRALLNDLRRRVERNTFPAERAFLAQRASAIAHLRLEDARAALVAAKAEADRLPAFGAIVKRMRLRAGMSQSELARRSGIDRAYVHRIEKPATGEPVVPSRQVVVAIADALELARFESDSLLVAGGYLPVAVSSAGGWRPEFALLADFLSDPFLSELDRAEFRQVLRAVLAHWRAGASAQNARSDL